MKPNMTGTSFFRTLSPHGSQRNPDQEKPEEGQNDQRIRVSPVLLLPVYISFFIT